MAIRNYLVQWVATGVRTIEWKPKYVGALLPDTVAWSGIRFGVMDDGLLAADVTPAQHSAMIANADVSTFPANLDNTVGANRATVEAALELRGCPGNWVTAAMTYRQVLRTVIGIFTLAQRFDAGEGQRLVPQGVTLATTYQDMPVDFRQRLLDAVDSLGYDRSSLTALSTLRDLMVSIGSQASPVRLLGQDL